MSDAREIIATKLPFADAIRQQWAQEIIDALTAAGYRILGPDEVDPVTLKKAIRIVVAAAPDDTGEWCPYRSWALRSVPALHALWRKA